MDITKLFEAVNKRVDTVVRRVERIEKIPTPEVEAWQAPTLLNSWVNYGGSESIAGYYKDPLGVVHIRGFVKSGTTAPGTAIFTLPSGYRPEYELQFPTMSYNALGYCSITTTGNVRIMSGSNVWFSLDLPPFRAV